MPGSVLLWRNCRFKTCVWVFYFFNKVISNKKYVRRQDGIVFALKSFLFYLQLLSFIKISTFPFLFFTLMIPEKAITQMKLEIESWVHAFLFIQYSHNSEIQDSPWFKGTDLLKNWNRIQTYEWHVFWEIWINVSNTFEEFILSSISGT